MNKISKIANEILGIRTLTVAQILARNKYIRTALTALDLLSETSKKSIKYESGCKARLKKAAPKSSRWAFTVKCDESWSEGPYTVRFKFLKGKTKDPMLRDVEVSCECKAWRFNGADYNALANDYSERQQSNGEAPNVRDRRRKYLICKHVAACIPLLSGYIVRKKKKKK